MLIRWPILLTVLLFVKPASAELSAKAVEFLQQISIDLDSERVKAVAEDKVQMRDGEIASLDELARKNLKDAVKRFIATRTFVHAYIRDANTRLPPTEDYEAAFLTPEEKAFVQPAFRKAGDELYLQSVKQKK